MKMTTKTPQTTTTLKDMTLSTIIDKMRAHFGSAKVAQWVHQDAACPCCLVRSVEPPLKDGKPLLSINAFMYRRRGVMIVYLLCADCAAAVLAVPHQTDLHKGIEETLVNAYDKQMSSLDA